MIFYQWKIFLQLFFGKEIYFGMETVLLVILAALALFVLIKLLTKPIKWIFKLLLNALSGFVMLWFINFFGDFFGIAIETNFLNALITGVLGIPGVILLLLTA